MTALAGSATPADRAAPTAPVVGRSRRGLGVGLMLFSAGSNQTGAALGAHAFPVLALSVWSPSASWWPPVCCYRWPARPCAA